MKTIYLNRVQYLDSVKKMDNFEALKFAKQSLDYWDDYFSWEKFPCLCLEEKGEHLCYIFYHISKDNRYFTLYNILTPYPHRFHGYAKILLSILLEQILHHQHIQRVKMLCVSSSLKFYLNLGVDFWGVNHLGQYYAEFDMPLKSIEEIPTLCKNEHLDSLSSLELETLYEKLKADGKDFDKKELGIFNNSKTLLGLNYKFDKLTKLYDELKI